MRSKWTKALALVCALALICTAFAGCGSKTTRAANADTPLVVGYSPFSEKFSPFYADTGYDQDVVSMTQLGLMTTDRMGGIIYNAIKGETVAYNGTDYKYTGIADLSVNYDEEKNQTTYKATLRKDIKFSDGEKLDIDDVIFTYYVYLDPAYVGSTSLSSYDIVGLRNYQTQTTDEVYEKYSKLATDIFAAGEGNLASGATQEMTDWYWNTMKENWTLDNQAIVDYVISNYLGAGYGEQMIGVADDAITEDLYVALGMALWGYASLNEEGSLQGAVTGNTWDLKTTFPTIEDYYAETYAKYKGDPDAYWSVEAADDTDVHGTTDNAFITYWGAQDEAMGGEGVKSISGITRVDDYTVEILVNGYSAPAVYSILGITIAPLHYYGDAAQYDYEAGKYGHPFGDLSIVEAKTTAPMGAGPYKFVKYENKVVYFEANENYYKGAPLTKYVQFKETTTSQVAAGVQTGTIDAGEMNGSKAYFNEVRGYNSNGELTGETITTNRVDNLGYGYIGLNADEINVGGEPGSDASKNLRKALATVFAVYRDTANNSYYGDAASTINYPISNTSWAAPQPTDEGYKVAFSTDVNGNSIYTAEMSADEKYAAAIEASLGFFEAAGYTVENGKVTGAPAGARGKGGDKSYTEFEVIIPADGVGDHPAFAILTDAKAALATIGITININDPADSNVLWDALDAGTHDMWTAAWGATIDPDMYQVYHSSNIVGLGGTDSNHYHIASDKLDELIMDARTSDDQSYRKQVYKEALNELMDWAVEIPNYQRQNCVIFSTERIYIDSITPDITTYWGWMSEIELIEMK